MYQLLQCNNTVDIKRNVLTKPWNPSKTPALLLLSRNIIIMWVCSHGTVSCLCFIRICVGESDDIHPARINWYWGEKITASERGWWNPAHRESQPIAEQDSPRVTWVNPAHRESQPTVAQDAPRVTDRLRPLCASANNSRQQH